jgi:single-stranded-DNA-specific exonuclease
MADFAPVVCNRSAYLDIFSINKYMKWDKPKLDKELVKSIAKQYGGDLITASILVRRNITGSEIAFFLNNSPDLLKDPFQLPGIHKAVNRIFEAKKNKE